MLPALPGRSAPGHSRSCSPPTGSGATGCGKDGSASSLLLRRRRRRRARQRRTPQPPAATDPRIGPLPNRMYEHVGFAEKGLALVGHSGKGTPAQGNAHAFWLRAPGCGEIRPVTLPEPGRDDVMVRTLRSGISRGTETLVFRGGVPAGQYAAMRAPFQEGDFPGPVKYGYLNVGAVEEGPPKLRGRTVFCLYPHQTAYVVPAGAVSVVPEGVPPARAVLAGTVETAVNALWDAAPLLGDRVAVVGAGMVGCCVARLLSRFPAVQVTLVDVDAGRADVAAALGVDFALPADAAGGRDLVVHASATSAGLA